MSGSDQIASGKGRACKPRSSWVLSLGLLATWAAPSHAQCAADEALTVVALSPALQADPQGLRGGDQLRAWLDAKAEWQPLCNLLDLARAELQAGSLAPLRLQVSRAQKTVPATLASGRHELHWQQTGSSAKALASQALLRLHAAARGADFVAARAALKQLPELPANERALALEWALFALEPDPDREAGALIAHEVVALREAAGGRALARAVVVQGRAEMLRRDLPAATTAATRAEQLLAGERSLLAAQVDLLFGAIAYLGSDHATAAIRYRAAIADIQAIAPASPALAGALSNLAALDVVRGDPEAALAGYGEALRILEASAPSSYLDARIHYNRGLALTELRRLAAAERDIEAAVARFAEVQPDGPEHLAAQAQLADVYNARGQHALAEARLRELLARLQSSAPSAYNTLAAEYQLANTLLRMRRGEEALDAFRALLAKLSMDRGDALRADTLNAYGQALLNGEQLAAGIAELDAAIDDYGKRQRAGLPLASALLARGDGKRRLGDLDAADGDLRQALALRQQLAPGSVLEAAAEHLYGRLERARGDPDAALTRYYRAIELLEQERWQQSENAELRALWTASYADFYREPLDLLLELNRLPAAFELDQRFRGRELALALSQPGRDVVTGGTEIGVDAASARLRPNQAALHFIVGHQRSWSLLLTRAGLRAQALQQSRDALRADIEALNVLLALPQPSLASQQAAIERAHRLYQQLIEPQLDSLADIDQLLLLTDDALHELSFAALVSVPAVRPVDARYLLERFELASAVQPFAGQAQAAPAQPTLLAWGDPVATPADTDSMSTQRLRGVGEAALPAARREALGLAALYGKRARALVGVDAVESQVLTAATDRLHFATHVVLDALQPLDSYIVLAADAGADGRLRAHEIAATPSRALDLVVLAGCASRQGANAAGEGLLGVARAWHVSGARNVLGSTWAIDDAATERIMLDFHRRLESGAAAPTALSATLRDWLAQGRESRWWQRDRSEQTLPFYWAGFVLSVSQP